MHGLMLNAQVSAPLLPSPSFSHSPSLPFLSPYFPSSAPLPDYPSCSLFEAPTRFGVQLCSVQPCAWSPFLCVCPLGWDSPRACPISNWFPWPQHMAESE